MRLRADEPRGSHRALDPFIRSEKSRCERILRLMLRRTRSVAWPSRPCVKGMGGTPMLRWALMLLIGAGCASDAKYDRRVERGLSAYFSGNYQDAAKQFRPLAEKTDENFVLNNLRLGSAELVGYDLEEAEQSFLRAY